MSLLTLFVLTSLLTARFFWIGPWPPQVDTIQTFWPNGQIKSEYFLLNHSEEESDSNWSIINWHRTWHENGQTHESLFYDDGIPQGFYTSYHPNGKLKEEGTLGQKRYGAWIKWYDNGQREEETIYPILGGYSKQRGWFPDGKLKCEINRYRDTFHGPCFWEKCDSIDRLDGFFFEGIMLVSLDSLKSWHQYYQPGEYYNSQNDLWITWDEAMASVWVGRKVNGARAGKWTHFLPNGEITVEEY